MKRPVLEWLLQAFPDTPRTRAKQWILAGRVKVAGTTVRRPDEILEEPGRSLQLTDRHTVALTFDPEWRIHPRLAVLYIDLSLAIVNKGAGLLSVPAPNKTASALDVLGSLLTGRYRPRESRPMPPAFRHLTPSPVHRLDLYTSGLLCIALNPRARAHLIKQFSAHTATRQYIAYVEGRPKTKRGTWRHWLRSKPDVPLQQVVPSLGGKLPGTDTVEAITHYEVLEEFPAHAKLRLRLETGRRHQIRAQAAHEGLPLVGDRMYHPAYRQERSSIRGATVHNPRPARPFFPRQALHAESLSLEHPERPGERLTWRTQLPDDLRRLEERLRDW